MKTTLSKAQQNYMQAKAHAKILTQTIKYKAGQAQANQQPLKVEEMSSMIVRSGNPIMKSLVDAENELIEWAHKAIKHEKEYRENKQEIEDTFKKAEEDHGLRQKLIDLAMKIR